MRNNNYVPYHIHSQLSNGITNIDSITDFHDYVDAAKELGIKAFAFAEHGNIFNWVKKKEYIESCGMKYIHAIEAYLTEDSEDRHRFKAPIRTWNLEKTIINKAVSKTTADALLYISSDKKIVCIPKWLSDVIDESISDTDNEDVVREKINFIINGSCNEDEIAGFRYSIAQDAIESCELLSRINNGDMVYFEEYWTDTDGVCYAKVNGGEYNGLNVPIELDEIIDDGVVKTKDNYHCVLIARNHDGVRELNRVISKSFDRSDYHYYYVPRITLDELFATSDNIIVTTACLGSVMNRGTVSAKERMLSFLTQNKHRCFLEIQHHNCADQIEYNKMLYALSKEIGVPLIAGTDTHALNEQHMEGRSMLQKAKSIHFADEDAWDLTFKSYDDLVAAYMKQKSLPMDVVYEAIENTNVMADMIEEFKLDYTPKYPKLYDDSEKVFKEKINAGVIERGINKLPNYKEYINRIRYEYDVYKHNGAIDFMLLEENYKSEMRKRGIRYGYSRGSVSGSIIAYLLHITEIDSVKYNLNFSRFMSPERISLADIDTDWYSDDRKTVKDYLSSKDGLYCCDIVTFNTIALKGAIRDVCRGLFNDNLDHLPDDIKKEIASWSKEQSKMGGREDYPPELVKKIKKYSVHKEVPYEYLDFSEEVIASAEKDESAARDKYPEVFKYVDLVNGVVVSIGNHPSACIVSPYPVDEWFGTFTTSGDEYTISMLNMKEIDSLNFVKLDVLGLDNIGLIYKTCDAAGIPFATPDNIPPDDQAVWDSIREDTTTIFQFESDSATAYLKQLFSDETIARIKEKNPNFSYIDLLSMGNGAIRPAGESYRDALSHGIYHSYGNEALDEFMKPTLGYMVYQCQIIEFLNKFCGYTMGQADTVRRCVSEETEVLISDGSTKKIKDIRVNDRVISLNENNIFCADTVSNVFDNGIQETYVISGKHNYQIRATKGHKLLTQRGWVKVEDLTIDDCIMTPKKIYCDQDGLQPSKRFTMKDSFLIGILIGDGTLGSDSIKFTNSDKALVDAYIDCIKSRYKGNVSFSVYQQPGETVDAVYSVYISSKEHRESIEKLISRLGLRTKAANKRIPDCFMLYPPGQKLLSLLGGLFSTDAGYIQSARCIEYSSISKRLCYDIKHLLLKFGIYSYVYQSKADDKYGYYCYKLRIKQRDSLKAFKELVVPYIVGEKHSKFSEIVEDNLSNDTYNYLLPRECKEEIWDMSEKTKTSLNSIINSEIMQGKSAGIHRGEIGITDTKARKIVQHIYCPYTYQFLMMDYIPIRIQSISLYGKEHVYDLEVKNNHNYIANDIIVHNCFAKKTGTGNHIPKIKEGFIKTMKEQYGIDERESERLVVDFIRVIEDASDYLFSKNHSDPYSWIGYICGYLRYYYPLEFITSALNIFADKEDKSLAIIAYAKKRGIPISPIKFRHSISQYSFDKESGVIFKGISSIKFLNEDIANEMYELRNNTYNSFIDLLIDLQNKTSLNSRQLQILIELDFFEEFGDCNKLLETVRLFDELYGKKQMKKEKCEKLNISEEVVLRHCGKATEKTFIELDSAGLLTELCDNIKYKPRKLKDRVAAQVEHLGYVDIADPSYDRMLAILDVDTKYAPKIKAHSLKNGSTLDIKIDRRTFNKLKVAKGDIILVKNQNIKPKQKKNSDGEWEPVPGTKEIWLTDYRKVESL